MTRLSTFIVSTIGIAFSAAAIAVPNMSNSEYQATKDSITAEYQAAKERCDMLTGNANDICVAEAQGKERVARAELEARFKPNAKNRYDASIAKAEADYKVAKEKCDDLGGNEKDVCLKGAKAAQAAAKKDAMRAKAP
jgi:hypothetical protein